MTVFSDAELYRRGVETLVASWESYALCASGAAVQRTGGVAAAVFPNEPERSVYNNTLLARDLDVDRALNHGVAPCRFGLGVPTESFDYMLDRRGVLGGAGALRPVVYKIFQPANDTGILTATFLFMREDFG